jgi:hypothetical protein
MVNLHDGPEHGQPTTERSVQHTHRLLLDDPMWVEWRGGRAHQWDAA